MGKFDSASKITQAIKTTPSADSSVVSPFGELITTNLVPLVQRKWTYGLSELDTYVEHDGATVTSSNQMLVLNTSATTSSYAHYETRLIGNYRGGQGIVARFTAMFTTGTTGTYQIAGVGNHGNGFFFGYDEDTFGILHRRGGLPEIRTLTLTNHADTAGGNITITINGDAVVVAVALNDTVGVVCTKIAAADWSTVGGGWHAHDAGNAVVFVAARAETRGGAYSFADTGTTGVAASFAQTLAAVAPTDVWIPQTSWNADRADGSMDLPALNSTKLNVFAIHYPYLGAGGPSFFVKDPVGGGFVLVHRLRYENAYTVPSVANPDLGFYFEVSNEATTDDLTLSSASLGLFNCGPREMEQGHTTTIIGTSGAMTNAWRNICTIRCKEAYAGTLNAITVAFEYVGAANENSTKILQLKVTGGSTVTAEPASGPITWTSAGSTSCLEYSTELWTPGDGIDATGGIVAPLGAFVRESDDYHRFTLRPGEIVTIQGYRASGTDAVPFTATFTEYR